MVDQRLLYLVAAVVMFFILVSVRRRREAIRHAIRRVLFAEGTYLLVVYFMVQAGRTALETLLAGLLCGLIVNQMMPGRSRHIPASVRRRKIAEYELKTGKKFNSRTHELDHEVPFSRGGSHTEDNLVVTEKRKNRSKGGRSPWWDVLGR
jgi:HNH endonuclease